MRIAAILNIIYCIILLSLPLVFAYTWIERVAEIDNDGTLLRAPGYIRGYVQRDNPLFTGEIDQWKLPPSGAGRSQLLPTDLMCRDTQLYSNYSTASPPLHTGAGCQIVLQYNENGHITKPWNNPPGKTTSGTVYVYGTDDSQPTDSFLGIYGMWNKDRTGGDRRGMLLGQFNFDDGKCYQYSTDSPIEKERQAAFTHPEDPEHIEPFVGQSNLHRAS